MVQFINKNRSSNGIELLMTVLDKRKQEKRQDMATFLQLSKLKSDIGEREFNHQLALDRVARETEIHNNSVALSEKQLGIAQVNADTARTNAEANKIAIDNEASQRLRARFETAGLGVNAATEVINGLNNSKTNLVGKIYEVNTSLDSLVSSIPSSFGSRVRDENGVVVEGSRYRISNTVLKNMFNSISRGDKGSISEEQFAQSVAYGMNAVREEEMSLVPDQSMADYDSITTNIVEKGLLHGVAKLIVSQGRVRNKKLRLAAEAMLSGGATSDDTKLLSMAFDGSVDYENIGSPGAIKAIDYRGHANYRFANDPSVHSFKSLAYILSKTPGISGFSREYAMTSLMKDELNNSINSNQQLSVNATASLGLATAALSMAANEYSASLGVGQNELDLAIKAVTNPQDQGNARGNSEPDIAGFGSGIGINHINEILKDPSARVVMGNNGTLSVKYTARQVGEDGKLAPIAMSIPLNENTLAGADIDSTSTFSRDFFNNIASSFDVTGASDFIRNSSTTPVEEVKKEFGNTKDLDATKVVAVDSMVNVIAPIADLVIEGETFAKENPYTQGNAKRFDLKGRHVNRGGRNKFNRAHVDTSLTIKDVLNLQDNNKLFAAGAGQFLKGTLRDASKAAGLPETAKYNPRNQARIITAEMMRHKYIKSYITGDGDINKAAKELTRIWRSLKTSSGSSATRNGSDNATIEHDRLINALRKARANYKKGRN